MAIKQNAKKRVKGKSGMKKRKREREERGREREERERERETEREKKKKKKIMMVNKVGKKKSYSFDDADECPLCRSFSSLFQTLMIRLKIK